MYVISNEFLVQLNFRADTDVYNKSFSVSNSTPTASTVLRRLSREGCRLAVCSVLQTVLVWTVCDRTGLCRNVVLGDTLGGRFVVKQSAPTSLHQSAIPNRGSYYWWQTNGRFVILDNTWKLPFL
jgi:hypothetical protein